MVQLTDKRRACGAGGETVCSQTARLAASHRRARSTLLLGLAVLTAVTVALTPSPATGADVIATWLTSDGLWTNAPNWDSNPLYPNNGNGGKTFDAVVTGATVTLDASVVLENLDLNVWALTGIGSLTTNGQMTWRAGQISGDGLVNINGSLEINGDTARLYRTLNNAGYTLWRNRWGISGNASSVFNNLGGATFEIRDDSAMTGTGARFSNQGIFLKTTSSGVTDVQWAFQSTGVVEVHTGTLKLSGGGSASGAVHVDTEASLVVSGSAYSFHDLAITGQGAVSLGVANAYFDGPTTFAPDLRIEYSGTSNVTAWFNGQTDLNGRTTLNDATLTGEGTVTCRTLDWQWGTMAGIGTTVIGPGGTLTIGTQWARLARTLTNAGTTVLTGPPSFPGTGPLSSAFGGSGAVFNNLAGATFDIRSDSGISDDNHASGWFSNAGLFVKSAGTGTSEISPYWTFDNAATVRVESGTLRVNGPFNNTGTAQIAATGTLELAGGGTSSGAFAVDSTGTLRFSAGTHDLGAGATISGQGNVTFAADWVTLADTYNVSGVTTFEGGTTEFLAPASLTGPVVFRGGTAAFNTPATLGPTEIDQGTISGSATATLSSMTFLGGSMTGTGMTVLAAGGTSSMTDYLHLARTLRNAGTVYLSGTGGVYNVAGGTTPRFENPAGAVLDVLSNAGFRNCDSVSAVFNNAGTFRKSGGTGTTDFESLWAFNNTGTVEVRSGTLNLAGGGAHSGRFDVSPTCALKFGGGTHTFSNGATFTGLGSVSVSGGSTLLTGAADLSFNSLTWTSGTMTGAGTLRTPTGGRLYLTGSTVYLGRPLTNAGIVNMTAAGSIYCVSGGAGATITNQAGALFDVKADGSFRTSNGASGTVNNAGTFRKSAGSGTAKLYAGWTFSNTGAVEVTSGTLSLPAGTSTGTFSVSGASVIEFSSGTHDLNGTAAFTGDGTLAVNGGTLAGDANLSVRRLSWTGGNVLGTGSISVPAGGQALITVSGSMYLSRTITNGGAAAFGGTATLDASTDGSGAVINNLAGATFDIISDADFNQAAGATALFSNAGTLRKAGGTGTTGFGSAWTVNNTGRVEVQTGTLQLAGGGTSSGAFYIGSAATVLFDGNTYTLGPTTDISGGGTITVGGGTVNFGTAAVNADLAVNVNNAAHANFTVSQRLGELHLGGTSLSTVTGSEAVLTTKALSMAVDVLSKPTAALDLLGNGLVIDYVEGATSPLAETAGWLRSGYNKGAGYWDGPGIRSSLAAAEPEKLTAVGILDNHDPLVGHRHTFEGQTVDDSSVLLKYTYWGDANFDGKVTFDDYDIIDYYYWFPLPADQMGWWTGDFDMDGNIDFDDYDLIDFAYWFQGAPLSGSPGVPEPATLALLALGGLALLRRRRK